MKLADSRVLMYTQGWTEKKHSTKPDTVLATQARPAFGGGLLMKGKKIVIPHNMHTKCLARAQITVWWPGKEKVSSCERVSKTATVHQSLC